MSSIPRRPSLLARAVARLAAVPSWVRWAAPLAVWSMGVATLRVAPTTAGPPLDLLQAAYVAVQLFLLSPHGFPSP